MKRDEMKKLLKDGHNPVLLSAMKWADVVYGDGLEDGTHNCALCYKYLDKSDGHQEHCVGCPVNLITGQLTCRGTPYDELCKHRNKAHYGAFEIGCDECNRLAAEELKFLLGIYRRDLKPIEPPSDEILIKVKAGYLRKDQTMVILPYYSEEGAEKGLSELYVSGYTGCIGHVVKIEKADAKKPTKVEKSAYHRKI